jgi:hypothetical protein
MYLIIFNININFENLVGSHSVITMDRLMVFKTGLYLYH